MATLDAAETSLPDLNAIMMLRVGPGFASESGAAGGRCMMSLWSERILGEFPPDLTRFWIAADPDDVLLDEHILSELRGRGFEVLPFEDAITFRADY